MSKLEKGFNDYESSKNSGLSTKTSHEIGETLDDEGGILQMIGDIEDEYVRNRLKVCLEQSIRKPEEIMEEISIYYSEVLPRLNEDELSDLYRQCKRKNLLPSNVVKEFSSWYEIQQEKNPRIKNLLSISLESSLPSVILRQKSIYQELALVETIEEKNLIESFLRDKLDAQSTKEEMEFYEDMKKESDENVRNLMLTYVSQGCSPSITYFYETFFREIAKRGAETTNKVIAKLKEIDVRCENDVVARIAQKIYYNRDIAQL